MHLGSLEIQSWFSWALPHFSSLSVCVVSRIVQDLKTLITQCWSPPLSRVNEKPWDAVAVNAAAWSTDLCIPPRPILKVSNHCLIRLLRHVDSRKWRGGGPSSVTVHLPLMWLSVREIEEILRFTQFITLCHRNILFILTLLSQRK